MDKLTRPSNYSVGSVATKPVLGAGARPTTIPLSYAQQGIWPLERIAGGQGTAFNQVTAWRIRGPVNIGALEKAVNAIVGRHEVLRTTFVARDGIPRQVISPEASIQLGLADIRGNAAPESQWSLVQAALREECETPFDLEHGPMIRARWMLPCSVSRFLPPLLSLDRRLDRLLKLCQEGFQALTLDGCACRDRMAPSIPSKLRRQILKDLPQIQTLLN